MIDEELFYDPYIGEVMRYDAMLRARREELQKLKLLEAARKASIHSLADYEARKFRLESYYKSFGRV